MLLAAFKVEGVLYKVRMWLFCFLLETTSKMARLLGAWQCVSICTFLFFNIPVFDYVHKATSHASETKIH